MRIAITRQVSPVMQECELTHLECRPIDVDLAVRQHHAYQEQLAALGCRVLQLPAEPDLPDSIFVEDTAIILDEAGIITRPGAASRRPETESIARALAPFRTLHTITAPGNLDGGDVLRLGKTLYVGLSSRSNQVAVEQMCTFLDPYGYIRTGAGIGRLPTPEERRNAGRREHPAAQSGVDRSGVFSRLADYRR